MSTTNLPTDEDLNQIAKAIVDLDRDKLMTLLTDDCEIQDVYLKSVELKKSLHAASISESINPLPRIF